MSKKPATKPAEASKPLPVAASADALFGINDRPEQTIELPEKGCSIVVREPDAATSAMLHKSVTDKDGNHDDFEFRCRWMFESMVKPKPEPHHLDMIRGLGISTFNRWLFSIGKKKEV